MLIKLFRKCFPRLTFYKDDLQFFIASFDKKGNSHQWVYWNKTRTPKLRINFKKRIR